MRYNSTPNPFTKYLKERMKKRKEKKERAEKEMGPAQLSTPRERERSEGQRGESTATELADLTPAREEGSGRLAATEGGWVSTFRL